MLAPVPPPAVAETYPGDEELVVCGAVQPTGTTIVDSPPLKTWPFATVKEKTSWVMVEPAVPLDGKTVIAPSPSTAFPSVKVVCAVSPEVSPVAVNWSVAPISSGVTSQVAVMFPLVSAVTVHG